METQKPIAKIRAGPVTCALWQNEITIGGKKQTVLKATVDRRYKDRDGTWKTSQSFSRNEVPMAIFALFKAFETMVEKAEDQDRAEPVEEERVI
jgi:hypothetical protein